MKKVIVFVLIIGLSLLCGCNGYKEIDRGFIATAIAFYKSENRAHIIIETSASSMTEQNTKRIILSGEGDDFDSAAQNLYSQLTAPIYFDQLGTAVFENSLTADEQGELLESFLTSENIKWDIYVVTADNVGALFKNDGNNFLGYDIIGLINRHEKQTSKRLICRYYELRRNEFNLSSINLTTNPLAIEVRYE